MNLFLEIGVLFSGMDVWVILCMLIGLIMVFIEIFEPGFGVFGILGGILLIASIVLRALKNDGNILFQVFFMLFMYAILIVGCFLIMIKMVKKGWLSRSPFVEKTTAVDQNYSDGTKNYDALIGKRGVVVCELKPLGRANIDGELYDVSTEGFFIKRGENIIVHSTEGNKILVKRVD